MMARSDISPPTRGRLGPANVTTCEARRRASVFNYCDLSRTVEEAPYGISQNSTTRNGRKWHSPVALQGCSCSDTQRAFHFCGRIAFPVHGFRARFDHGEMIQHIYQV